MSEQKSPMPMIIAGFILIALAVVFGLNMNKGEQTTAQSPSNESFERAGQAASEAIDSAKDAADAAAEGIKQEADQASDAVKEAAEKAGEKFNEMAPAAGAPAQPQQ
jgi:hypothetical protein